MHLITLNATDHPQPPVIDRVLLIDESPDPRARDLGKRRGRGRHRQRGPDLIRLLADRGIEGDKAHDHLKDLLQVNSLKEVSKAEASRTIENLLAEGNGGKNGSSF